MTPNKGHKNFLGILSIYLSSIQFVLATLAFSACNSANLSPAAPTTGKQVLPQSAPAKATIDGNWNSVPPETEGYSSSKLANLAALATNIHSPAGMVIVDGNVIYSWGDLTEKMWIHSARKSFLSALIGIAVQQGTINLSSTLLDLGIDDIPPSLTDEEKTATVQDLLEARSGVYHLSANDTPGMDAKRPARGSHAPGTFWYYNNWDFNALGGIYEQETSTSIFDALYTQIALPTGMQDYTPADGQYSYQRNLSNFPGYLMNLSTRDMARFGQLYLQHGQWNGKQVVPSAWFTVSTTSYSDASSSGPPGTGYGYLWWTGSPNGTGMFNGPNLSAGAFAAEGYGGHYIIVIPSRRMVVVSRADDQWFDQDPPNNSIGPNREGQLLNAIFSAQLN